jgi:hypothetical protein
MHFWQGSNAPILPSLAEGLRWETQTDGNHLREVGNTALVSIDRSSHELDQQDVRGFHGAAPLHHCGSPPFLQFWSLGHHIGGVESRELRRVRRGLAHPPEESAFGIGVVTHDVQRSLRRGKSLDNAETGLVHCAFGFLSVFEGHTDLPAEFGAFIFPQELFGLGKVVLDKVEKGIVVFGGDSRVVQDESTVNDESIGSLWDEVRL